MSGVVALVQRGGGPADAAAFDAMLERLRHRAIDGSRAVDIGWARLGHCHFWTVPEELGERQPVTDAGGRFVLAFDGRLDNRSELARTLGLGTAEAGGLSDAVLALAVLGRWGRDGLARLLGPFALLLVDQVEKTVLLARDTLGDRGLFYAVTPGAVAVSSEEASVLACPGVGEELDDGRLSCHFALREPDDDSTFYRSVKQVLPGHALVVEGGSLRSWCFRSVRAESRPQARRDTELVDLFAETLSQAVACRMRTVGRPAVLLSGGLDSGPMAALAAVHTRAAGVPSPLAVSWVFDRFSECDERRYIHPVVARHGLEPVEVLCDDALPLSRFDSWPVNRNCPVETPYRWLAERCYRRAREAGARAVLSGVTGDDLYVGARDWLPSLLASGDAGAALRGARAFAGAFGGRALFRGSVVLPLLPRSVHRVLRPLRPPDWLTAEARDRLRGGTWPPSARRARRPGQAAAVAGLGNAEAVAGESYHGLRCGIDLRYPFRDLRLVELMLAVPSRLVFAGDLTRPILRRALGHLLPVEVLRREDKAEFSPLYRAAVASPAEASRLRAGLEGASPTWRRFVRAEWVGAAAPGERASQAEELVLWNCAWLELWRQKLVECVP